MVVQAPAVDHVPRSTNCGLLRGMVAYGYGLRSILVGYFGVCSPIILGWLSRLNSNHQQLPGQLEEGSSQGESLT